MHNWKQIVDDEEAAKYLGIFISRRYERKKKI